MSNTDYKPSSLKETFFIKRTFALLVVFGVLLGGYVSWEGMTKEDNPDLTIPIVTVQTTWPGRDPESIEKQITNKLEEEIKTVEGLKKYESASFNSTSIIKVEFQLEEEPDTCVQRLSAKINSIEDLPSDAFQPVIEKKTVNDSPVLTINLYGDINISQLNKVANSLKDEVLKVNGVQKVDINGERKDRIFIALKQDILSSLNLSPLTVKDAIQKAHKDTTLDTIESDTFSPQIKVYGFIRSVEALKKLTVAHIGNQPILLGDIAEIRRDLEKEKTRIRLSAKGGEFQSALSLSVFRAPRSDTVRLIENSLKNLENFKTTANWPSGLNSHVTTNNAIDIERSLNSIVSNVGQAIALVFIVLFFALTWRESLVAGLAIPIALCATLVVCNMIGFTLNKLVVIGMVLALGMLVDVFILMMEGMHEHLYFKKMSYKDSVFATIKAYALPAFTGQLTTILAFLPLSMMGGIDGKFIRIIPIVVSICLVMSYLISLFICLPLSWYVFKSVKTDVGKTWIDKFTEKTEKSFSLFLNKWVVKNKLRSVITLIVGLGFFAFAIFTAKFLIMEMYSKADAMDMGATIELDPDSTLENANEVAKAVGEVFRQKGFIDSVVSYTGMRSPINGDGAMQISNSFSLVGFGCRMKELKGEDSRNGRMSHTYINELREETEAVLDKIAPGAKISFYVNTGGTGSGAPVQLRVYGNDLQKLRNLTNEIKQEIATVPGTADIGDNLGSPKFTINATPNYEALNFYNLNASTLGAQLRLATGFDKIATMPDENLKEEPEIRMGTYWPSRNGLPGGPMSTLELQQLRVMANNESLPMPALMIFQPLQAVQSITHFDGNRAAVISSYTDKRTPNDIVKDIKIKMNEIVKSDKWPEGFTYTFGGEAEQSGETSTTGPLLIALFMVFSVLAMQFGNFSQPFVIMMSLPLALGGIVFGFFFLSMPFSFPAMIGAISLIGIVVNDSIVMVDTMNVCKRKGMDIAKAAAEGCASRLRPILVTTITTVLGLIPLAISDPVWQPLCVSIISGLLVATFVSLLVIPALYNLLTSK